MTIDVLGRYEIGRTCGEKGFWSTEIEAHNPGLGKVDLPFRGWKEENIFTPETFMDLMVVRRASRVMAAIYEPI